MSDDDFEEGKRAFVLIQEALIDILGQGFDQRTVSLAVTNIGIGMLMEHYGTRDGVEIGALVLKQGADGKLVVAPALKASSETSSIPDNIIDFPSD